MLETLARSIRFSYVNLELFVFLIGLGELILTHYFISILGVVALIQTPFFPLNILPDDESTDSFGWWASPML